MQISSFSLFTRFPIKVTDVKNKIIKIQELNSPKGDEPILCQIGIVVQI